MFGLNNMYIYQGKTMFRIHCFESAIDTSENRNRLKLNKLSVCDFFYLFPLRTLFRKKKIDCDAGNPVEKMPAPCRLSLWLVFVTPPESTIADPQKNSCKIPEGLEKKCWRLLIDISIFCKIPKTFVEVIH